MIISLIAAVAENNVIGKDNDLVWQLPHDMQFFMNTTSGHCILSGRKNYQSIPKKWRPLKNRTNIVVTTQPDFGRDEDIKVVHDIHQGIAFAERAGEKELFVIGGGQIYAQTLDLADKLYITKVHQSFDGDTYFPDIPVNQWKTTSRILHPKDARHDYSFEFTTLVRQ